MQSEVKRMGKYLDPKADLVFKKIFNDHPHLLKSFLNAVLPLPEDRQIVELEHLPVEQVPKIPVFKRTIVDVKCKDREGRIFIVEMQIQWTDSFMQRLLFGAANAYVKQLSVGEEYDLLNPVYGLALINSIFDEETPEWYHHYGLVKLNNPQKEIIRGLTLVFVELAKLKVSNLVDKKLKVLWLRFMREINDKTKQVAPELLAVPEIKEALFLAEEAGYTPAELEAYEAYWKAVSSEKTMQKESWMKGNTEGIAEATLKIAREMKNRGSDASFIKQCTGLSDDEIDKLT